ncbi:MAG: T9SS type A sorting domain-containing protein [Bacteroidia bacterium]
MKRIIQTFLIVLAIPVTAFSQSWEWEKSIGSSATADNGYAICADGLGNCYVASKIGTQGFVSKYNSSGSVAWSTGMIDQLNYEVSISYDAGQIYYAGDSSGSVFIVRLDTSGNTIWKTNCGTGRAKGIAADGSGHVYLTGTQTSLVKLDTSGSILWSHIGSYPRGISICTDLAGSVYVTGEFGGTTVFGMDTLTALGSQDIFIAKYDPSGNCNWAKRAGGNFVGFYSDDRGNGICTDNAGNLYVTGSYVGSADFDALIITSPPQWSNDVFIAKYDTSGNAIWVRAATGVSDQEGRCIAVDYQGNILIGGSFVPTLYFSSSQLYGWGNYDAFVAKYDPVGNLIATIEAGEPTWNEFVYGICIDNLGNVFVAGTYTFTAHFGTDSLAGQGDYDAFAGKIDFITAVEEINSVSTFLVFPNPASSAVTVCFAENAVSDIVVMDALGQEVLQQKTIDIKQISIPIETLPVGIYFFSCYNNGEIVGNGKFIVWH